MTPEQISQTATRIAGDRAVKSAQSQMNLLITCVDAATATVLRDELRRDGLQATNHMRFADVVVVQLRARQQIIIRKSQPSHYIGRFNGDRGER